MVIKDNEFIVYWYDLPSPLNVINNLLLHRDFRFFEIDPNLLASAVLSCQHSLRDACDNIHKAYTSIENLKKSIDSKNPDNLPIRFDFSREHFVD